MAKWRLLFKAIPAVIIILALRYVVLYVLDVNIPIKFADAGSVITGATLILGLMLGGVMGDYKESEKLPAAIGGGLSGLDGLAVRGLQVKDQDATWARERVGKVGVAINDWLYGRIDDKAMWAAYGEVSVLIVDLEKAGVPTHYLARLFAANADLGGALSRTAVIRNTTFIKTGYALMELLVAIVLGLMVIVSFPAAGDVASASDAVQWIVAGVLTLAYTYLPLLVKDLDDPFEYGKNNGEGSAADVDITPFKNAFDGLLK